MSTVTMFSSHKTFCDRESHPPLFHNLVIRIQLAPYERLLVESQLPGSYAAEPESTHCSSSSLEAFFGSLSWLMWQMNSFPSLSFTHTNGSDGFVGSVMLVSFHSIFFALEFSEVI